MVYAAARTGLQTIALLLALGACPLGAAAVGDFHLAKTGMDVAFATEQLFHTGGTPRPFPVTAF